VEHLYVGDRFGALEWAKTHAPTSAICVIGGDEMITGQVHIPVLDGEAISPGFDHVTEGQPELRANLDRLDAIVSLADAMMREGKDVLVHCSGANERSPLTCAWILYRTRRAPTWDVAYGMVKRVHPQTQDRSHWIPWAVRNP
jgi:hypothetical protein